MTAHVDVVAPGRSAPAVRQRRQRRLRGLQRRRDALHAGAWIFTLAILSFFLASGPVVWLGLADAMTTMGRLLGILGTVLVLVQIALASRAPLVERALGHDRAVGLHAALGQPIVLLLLAHGLFLTAGWAWSLDRSLWQQYLAFFSDSRWIALSIVGMGLLLIVGVTSVMAVRRRWPYETWHAIHLMAYAGVALSVPHQFFDGSTFRSESAAAWLWGAAYVAAFGALLVWRVGVPVWRGLRHRLVVVAVRRDDDGTVTVTMTGRHMSDWEAQPGQFLLWRFWTRDLWLGAHPYSLSAAPDGRSMRITVAALGDDSTLLRNVQPGTRVTASGPYGLFTHEARTEEHLVLIAAGVGATPVRALLEDPESTLGSCDVILRARSAREMPLLEEISTLASERGVKLHVLLGHRGAGWAPDGADVSVADLVPALASSDVFICGPQTWADAVERDARRAGVPAHAIHRDTFGW